MDAAQSTDSLQFPRWIHYPAVSAALAFAFGIAVGDRAEIPWWLWCLVAGSFALASLAGWRTGRWLLLISISLAGAAHASMDLQCVPESDIRHHVRGEPKLGTLRGQLLGPPELRETTEPGRVRTLARIRAASWTPEGSRAIPVTGNVIVSIRGQPPGNATSGADIRVNGVLRQAPQAVAKGLFDYREYLNRAGIHSLLIVNDTNLWGVLNAESPSLPERFIPWAQKVLARGIVPQDDTIRLTWAMALGWKTALTPDVSAPYMQSGTLHVFAISGLHVAMLSVIVIQILKAIRVPRAACGIASLPVVWFYIAATGAQPSAVRSGIMTTLVVFGWILWRPVPLIHSLAFAALVILVWEPGQLFATGFQLSFTVVASLAVFTPPWQEAWKRWTAPNSLIPREQLPPWRKWLEGPLHGLGTSVGTTVAAFIGTIPLSIHYFHLVNPVSLVANLVIVPISSLALVSDVGALLCGDWLPQVGELFNASGWLWMKSMDRLSRWFAEWPGAYCYVPHPGWIWLSLVWIVPLAFLIGIHRNRIGRISGIALLSLLAVAATVQLFMATQTTEIHILPGTAGIVVDAPGRKSDLVINCGREHEARFLTVPFLQSIGFNALPTLALSQVDLDHAGGIRILGESYPPRTIVIPDFLSRSPAQKRLRTFCEEQKIPLQTRAAGQALSSWEIRHPPPDTRQGRASDASLVFERSFGPHLVRIIGSLSSGGEKTLLADRASRTPTIQIQIPNKATAPAPVRPEIRILQSAEGDFRRAIPPQEMEGWRTLAGTTWSVQHSGVVRLSLRKDRVSITSYRPHFEINPAANKNPAEVREPDQPREDDDSEN